MDDSRIHVGVGGWTFEPWRNNFYPPGLAHSRELHHASRQLTAIEVNGTYYSTMKPATFAKWRGETPDGFLFTLKANRFATNRKVLATAGESIERFVASGIAGLGDRLGPILWQFMHTKKFDAEDFEAFLKLLPKTVDGRAVYHAVEVRHASFRDPDFIAMAREHGVAVVIAGDSEYPEIADVTAPFVYARIMGTRETEPLGYSPAELDLWADRARSWSLGAAPEDLPVVAPLADRVGRDVYLYVISGHKMSNPMAAGALIERMSLAAGA